MEKGITVRPVKTPGTMKGMNPDPGTRHIEERKYSNTLVTPGPNTEGNDVRPGVTPGVEKGITMRPVRKVKKMH